MALLIHGFSPVNAWLLITCDTAFYAIICIIYTYFQKHASQDTVQTCLVKSIYVMWTPLPQLFGLVYFHYQGVLLVFIITMFYRNSCINAKCEAFDHSLHYLPVTLLEVFRLKWVKIYHSLGKFGRHQIHNIFLYLCYMDFFSLSQIIAATLIFFHP